MSLYVGMDATISSSPQMCRDARAAGGALLDRVEAQRRPVAAEVAARATGQPSALSAGRRAGAAPMGRALLREARPEACAGSRQALLRVVAVIQGDANLVRPGA